MPAHMARLSGTRTARERLPARAIGHNINTARNLEREGFIGQTDIFLELCERKTRLPALRIRSDEADNRQRAGLDRHDEPIVVGLAAVWNELQRFRAARKFGWGLDDRRGEIACQVAFAGETQHR